MTMFLVLLSRIDVQGSQNWVNAVAGLCGKAALSKRIGSNLQSSFDIAALGKE